VSGHGPDDGSLLSPVKGRSTLRWVNYHCLLFVLSRSVMNCHTDRQLASDQGKRTARHDSDSRQLAC
jgi:hypothetical protein